MKNINKDSFFLLFANCMPVKGAARSLICDLQRGKYYYIPNDLYDILQITRDTKLTDIYNLYDKSNHEIVDEYFDYLLENDLGLIDDEPTCFLK